jgi:hypothetical protein
MMDDMEQMIKEHLLKELIEKMSDGAGDRMKPKGLEVEMIGKGEPAPELEASKDHELEEPSEHDGSESDDEQRLMELLGDDDEDEPKK